MNVIYRRLVLALSTTFLVATAALAPVHADEVKKKHTTTSSMKSDDAMKSDGAMESDGAMKAAGAMKSDDAMKSDGAMKADGAMKSDDAMMPKKK